MIHGFVGHDQNAQGRLLFAPSPADALTGCGDCARKTNQDDRIKVTNINAQFQGGSGEHRSESSGFQTLLNIAPFCFQIATAITANAIALLVWEDVSQISEQHFHSAARARENERLVPDFNQFLGKFNAEIEAAFTDAQFLIYKRWVIDNQVCGTPGRAVFCYKMYFLFNEVVGMLLRVPDGGGGQNKLGISIVKSTNAFQPADEIGEM